MKKVTIHSIWSKQAPTDRVFTYTVEVPEGTTVMETLENAYCMTNMDDRPRRLEVPSTTAGDIILADGQHWLVENVGYHKLTPEEVAWISTRLTSLTTTFGYAFLVEQGHLDGMKEVKI